MRWMWMTECRSYTHKNLYRQSLWVVAVDMRTFLISIDQFMCRAHRLTRQYVWAQATDFMHVRRWVKVAVVVPTTAILASNKNRRTEKTSCMDIEMALGKTECIPFFFLHSSQHTHTQTHSPMTMSCKKTEQQFLVFTLRSLSLSLSRFFCSF